MAGRRKAKYTNFYTPQNDNFYASFKYPPLNPGQQEIRLLKVDLSGAGQHTLIHNVPINTTTNYSTISYYSGDPTKTTPIIVDGHRFHAFANLSTAIKQVIAFWKKKNVTRILYLWTDQVCINQSDSTEKSHQVNFMSEIYRRCEQVFISMPLRRSMNGPFNWLQALSAAPGLENNQNRGYQSLPEMRAVGNARTPEGPSSPNLEQYVELWDIMYDLLEHDWWTRAWIYQEFMLAPRAHFLFSRSSSIEWDKLAPIMTTFLGISVNRHLLTCAAIGRDKDCTNAARTRWKWMIERDICDWDDEVCEVDRWCSSRDLFGIHKCQDDCDSDCDFCFLLAWILWPLDALLVVTCRGVARTGFPACLPCTRVYKAFPDSSTLNLHSSRIKAISTINARKRVEYVVRSKMEYRSGQQESQMKLARILSHARNTRTSQAKDKIYAFLGLIDSTRYSIKVDYEASYTITDVIIDAGRAIIQNEHEGINILFDAGIATSERRVTASHEILPSWVPDWAAEEDPLRGDDFLAALRLPPDCHACGQQYQMAPVPPSFAADTHTGIANPYRVLGISGICVDVLDGPEEDSYKAWRHFRGTVADASGAPRRITTASIARRGDEVWVFCGAKWPFVLRHENERSARLILLSVASIFEHGASSPIMFGILPQNSEVSRVEII